MTAKSVIPTENAINKILVIRNQKVILDRDLAVLYGVETRALKQSVRRNLKRFPADFMFVLNKREIDMMVSQNVIPSKSYLGGANPMAFTEQGVAMLSSVLKSERAIENKLKEHDDQIIQIIQVINQLITPPASPKRKIGFSID